MADDRATAWHRWQLAAGWWQGWSICPSLHAAAVPEAATHPPRDDSRAAAMAARLAAELETQPPTLLALELEPVLGVQVAARLNERRLAHAVLLVPRWPYREAVLPTGDLLAVVLREQHRLCRARQLPHAVFVLDAERQRILPARPRTDPRADNRYRLAVADLPNLGALRARGIRRVVRVASTT